MRFHYIYRLEYPATGEFYIGKRTSRRAPENDSYMGSGRWPSRMIKNGCQLEKTIVRTCLSEAEAYAEERALVALSKSHLLCRNIADGGVGLTSAVAVEIMNRPERKAIARAVVLRYNAERVRHMNSVMTPAQRTAVGIAGGSAGKGVSRNAGTANPNHGKPPEYFAAHDDTVFVLENAATGSVWRGTKSQMRAELGKSPHWYSLCSGARKSCFGYRLA